MGKRWRGLPADGLPYFGCRVKTKISDQPQRNKAAHPLFSVEASNAQMTFAFL